MGYGTGAIMAVPGQDERDWEFAERFGLPIVRTVQPPDGLGGRGLHRRRPGDQLGQRRDLPGRAGRRRGQGRDHRLAGGSTGVGERHGHLPAARLAVQPAALLGRAVPDRLRRGRPADRAARVDAAGRAARGRRLLAADLRPRTTPTSSRSRRWPARATGSTSSWTWATGRSGTAARRTRCRSGPARAGTSCATWTRPTTERFVDPEVERYWMGPRGRGDAGGVDLYVGGVEHAVLHLLYARFWHKVLYDLGHVSSSRAVPPAVQPGLHPGLRLHRRARHLRPGRRGRRGRDGTATSVAGRAGQPRVREDGQEPEEHRSRPTTCATSTAPTPSGVYEMSMGPLDVVPAVGDPGGRRLATASCSGCGATSSTSRPASVRVVDDDPPTTRPGGCCTARSTASARTTAACGSTPRSPS